MTNDALLPCPFCGSPVDIEEVQPTYSPEFGKRRWWGIQCRNTLSRGGTCTLQIVPQDSAEAATERWNTRAPSLGWRLHKEPDETRTDSQGGGNG